MNTMYEKTRRFLYRNARPLDIARWQYHFENGSKEAVLTALSCYQNEDGGFGHALEADAWNPNSSPIQTWVATEILREIEFTDAGHPIIQGILRYLASGQDFSGHFWYNTVLSNNDYPHAMWWHTESVSTCHTNYNPSACLIGFVIRYADKSSDLYALGYKLAKEAFDDLMSESQNNDMHGIACYIRLMEYCRAAGEENIIDLNVLEKRLRELVQKSITQDKVKWENGYVCRPSQFFNNRDSVFYQDSREIAEYECEFIKRTQGDDGSWNITWCWRDFPNEWAISKNWWKGTVAVQNMIYLKNFGAI